MSLTMSYVREVYRETRYVSAKDTGILERKAFLEYATKFSIILTRFV